MAEPGYLTIGKVVAKLQPQYPDLSVSKIRFLEDEGLLDPSRTSGGYRLYSPRDIKRLETILFLQKTRFLPLSVIKEELDHESSEKAAPESQSIGMLYPQPEVDDEETRNKFHDIEKVPDLLGVTVSFVRQLAEIGLIELRRSPHGRDLVDGHDFVIIRTASELRRFGIEPRNLRQYLTAAYRESAMFEQVLVPYSKRAADSEGEGQQRLEEAFDQVLALTNTLRSSLIRKSMKDLFSNTNA